MKPARRVSSSGLELIKRFEGYRRSAARLADGRWTFGYGHVRYAKEGAEVSHDDAEALLIFDLLEVGAAIDKLVHTPLSQNQFDALSSFAFNVGAENFKTSSVLRRVNEGELTKASFALEIWRRAAFEDDVIVVDALVRRRAAEKALFLTPDSGFVPLPTPVLAPEIDFHAECRPPLRRPMDVRAPLTGDVAIAKRASESSALVASPSVVAASVSTLSQRLRDLVPDEPAGGGFTEEPHQPSTSAQEPEHFPEGVQVVEHSQVPDDLVTVTSASEPNPDQSLVRLLGFSAGGLLLFGFAVFWRLNADTGFGGQALSYIAGIFGIILIFYAANLLLKRFGDESN